MQSSHQLRSIPALDGVRGLAVAAVVLFHFPTNSVVPGGQFGVDVFFVLSGFLVTAGLLDEAERRDGLIRYQEFLVRRAWRLLPALVAFLAVFLVMAALFHGDTWFTSDPFGTPGAPVPMTRAFKGVMATLLYVYNVFVIRGWTTAMPLAHLWTLAIEGQFYVGWALLLRHLLRRRPGAVVPVTLVIITSSAAIPWVVWHGGTGANAIYFGTLPRLQQLLAGAAVAQVWHRGSLDRVPLNAMRAAAAVGAATLVVVCLKLGNQTFKYLGAETVNALAASAVIAFQLLAPASALSARALAAPPLRWLGTRSYAIYLWHWPMAVWTNPLPNSWAAPLGIAASLILAETSWRLVEQPAQRRRRRLSRPLTQRPN